MMKSFLATTAVFAALASAYTPPTNNTFGALYTPNTQDPVTTGQIFTITWQPPQDVVGETVSLVLCNGPSSNCVPQHNAIVEKVDAAAGSYQWIVPCSLPAGTQGTDTGYGMLIIVDGTGQFQYSTQFSVIAGSSCSSSTTTTTTTSSSTSTSISTSSTTSKSSSTTSSSVSTTTTSPSSTSTTTKIITSTPIPVSSTTTHSSMTTSTVSGSTTMSSPSSSSTTSTKPFTGAAAVPTAFANVAGIMGAAVLGALAL